MSSKPKKKNMLTLRLTDEQDEKLTEYCERTGRAKAVVFRKFVENLDKIADQLFNDSPPQREVKYQAVGIALPGNIQLDKHLLLDAAERYREEGTMR